MGYLAYQKEGYHRGEKLNFSPVKNPRAYLALSDHIYTAMP